MSSKSITSQTKAILLESSMACIREAENFIDNILPALDVSQEEKELALTLVVTNHFHNQFYKYLTIKEEL